MPPTTMYEFINYMNSTKVDYQVRNIYMNSMNIQIHVLIDFNCFRFRFRLRLSFTTTRI
jgi:hypothetical protein